jgi:hypothetical protein
MIKNIVLIFVSAAILGCTHVYKPRPETFKMDEFTEFSSPITIAVLNEQPDNVNHVHLDRGIADFSGNKNAWTDTAIEIVKRELVKRQAVIQNNASKKLALSILSIKASETFWAIRYITKLRVKTGNGYESIFIGDNRSPATVFRAADGAIMRAVSAMFRDPVIIKYISKK